MEADASNWMIVLRTFGALGLVVGLIFVISFVAKKYLRPERWAGASMAGMKIVQSFSLEPKKKLVIVEVENQRLLLGLSDSSISYLCSLSAKAGSLDATEANVEFRHASL